MHFLKINSQRDPFNIPEKADAMILARFLIEDNQQNMVEVNLGVRCHYKVARSVFKSLIGRVKIYASDEEEQIIWEKCVEEIQKNSAALKQYAEIYFSKKNQETNYTVNWEQIKNTFVYASNDFDNHLIDYVLIRLFEETNNITKLSFIKIFEIFDPKNWRNMDIRSKNSLIFKPDKNDSTESEEEYDDASQSSNVQNTTSNNQINTKLKVPTINLHRDSQLQKFDQLSNQQQTQRSSFKYISPQNTGRR